jgi:hypothetical protein
MIDYHWAETDTWRLGVGWLREDLYGEGGLFINLGYWELCFWEDI